MAFIRRRRVILGIVAVLGVGAARLLYGPLALESYRPVHAQTLTVVGYGSANAWTRISDVTETSSTITISVDTFTFRPFPGTALASRLFIDVQLAEPPGERTVIDGSTGHEVPRSDG